MPHPVHCRDFHSSSGSGPYLASFGLSVTTSRICYLTLYRSYATGRISLAHRGASPEGDDPLLDGQAGYGSLPGDIILPSGAQSCPTQIHRFRRVSHGTTWWSWLALDWSQS